MESETSAATLSDLTSSDLSHLTSSDLTSSAISSCDMTSDDNFTSSDLITSNDETSNDLISNDKTYSSLTSNDLTTNNLTSDDLKHDLTSKDLTSNDLTSDLTSTDLTSNVTPKDLKSTVSTPNDFCNIESDSTSQNRVEAGTFSKENGKVDVLNGPVSESTMQTISTPHIIVTGCQQSKIVDSNPDDVDQFDVCDNSSDSTQVLPSQSPEETHSVAVNGKDGDTSLVDSEERISNGLCETLSQGETTPSSSNFVTTAEDLSLTPSLGSFQRESSEPPCDSDEEYFEEFHLPNTHENAFVRHLSFRRKVQTTPIHAPDAERIEGLVRTGEFIRHGSIRKKILPEEPLEEQLEDAEDDEDIYDKSDSSFSQRIERDLREFERCLSEESATRDNLLKEALTRTTSTPKAWRVDVQSEVCRGNEDADVPKNEFGFESPHGYDENSSIEESTLRKIQDCLDFSSYRNLLNLSGRLSDILSPKEVEEVLSNSERYRQYLDSEVIEALSLSFQGQTQSLPYTVNTTPLKRSSSEERRPSSPERSSPASDGALPNPDSGFSSPKTPKEEEEEEKNMEEEEKDMEEEKEEERPVTRTPVSSRDDMHLVRRTSTARDGIGAQGIFDEVHASNSDLRKIAAPEITLDWEPDTNKHDISDEDNFDQGAEPVSEEGVLSGRKRISVNDGYMDTAEMVGDVSFGSEAIEEETRPQFESSATDLPPLENFPAPPPPDLIPELTAAEEFSEMRHWRNVVIGGAWRRIDMKVIAPYRKCITHGGYMENSQSPIVVLSAALLPDSSRRDYHYVMDNLFMYVLSYLEQLASDNYVLVYFSGGLQNKSAPGFHWMRRAYEMIDRRLRKNLKSLLVVHPSLWSRTILTLSRPFVSSKFYRKLHFVRHLIDLAELVPLEQLEIPDAVKQADFEVMIRDKKKSKGRR